MEENMKISKTIMAALTVAFLTTNCIVLDGGGTTTTYVSEGSTSSPVWLDWWTDHSGEVDGTYSSFYAFYDGWSGYGYTFYLNSLSADADLYCYDDGNAYTYSYDYSINGGTTSESCSASTGTFSYSVYAEVAPVSSTGASYFIYVY
jgi:hypothetical protein